MAIKHTFLKRQPEPDRELVSSVHMLCALPRLTSTVPKFSFLWVIIFQFFAMKRRRRSSTDKDLKRFQGSIEGIRRIN